MNAWYILIVVRYEQIYHLISHGTGNTINIRRLAKTCGFGGPDKPDDQLTKDEKDVVSSYLGGWRKWSLRPPRSIVLEPNMEIDPNNDDHMLTLAAGMFSHEATFATPLLESQIQTGIDQARTLIYSNAIAKSLIVDKEEERENSQSRFRMIIDRLRGRYLDD